MIVRYLYEEAVFFILISVIIMAQPLFNQDANASAFQIEKKTYLKGDIILVSGQVDNYANGTKVTIRIFDNYNDLLLNSTTYPKQDGFFLSRIPTNDTDWKTGGPYHLRVQYGTCCDLGDSTFTFYSDQLPPLKQEDAGLPFWDLKCNSGLVMMMKQEDGAIACINPNSIEKLVALNWGYNPSEKITTYGLKSIYHTGQEIDFKFRVNGFGNGCDQPNITIRNSDQQVVWKSSQYITGCATVEQSEPIKNEAFLGRESHLGYDYNNYGPMIINETGTYSIHISWLDGNITKQFTVVP